MSVIIFLLSYTINTFFFNTLLCFVMIVPIFVIFDAYLQFSQSTKKPGVSHTGLSSHHVTYPILFNRITHFAYQGLFLPL